MGHGWLEDAGYAPDPTSTLGRLFMWGRFARENFITEAFAAAVRADVRRRPTAEILQLIIASVSEPVVDSPFPWGRSVLGHGALWRVRDVLTQVPLPGDGVLDLLIELEAGELWIEVKAGSPEGIDVLGSLDGAAGLTRPKDARRQLDTYLGVANQLTARDDRPRAVVLLSTDRLNRDDVPWLPWMAVRDAVLSQGAVSDEWIDLVRFLEETKVADDRTHRIRALESASITPAKALIRKAAEVTWRVHEEAVRPRNLPTYAGPGALLNLLGHSLAIEGHIIATATRKPVGLIGYGLVDHDGEAWWAVLVRAFKAGGPFAKAVRDIPSLPTLTRVGWRYHDGVNDLLVKSRRAVDFSNSNEAVEWTNGAFTELEQTGALALLFPEATRLASAPSDGA